MQRFGQKGVQQYLSLLFWVSHTELPSHGSQVPPSQQLAVFGECLQSPSPPHCVGVTLPLELPPLVVVPPVLLPPVELDAVPPLLLPVPLVPLLLRLLAELEREPPLVDPPLLALLVEPLPLLVLPLLVAATVLPLLAGLEPAPLLPVEVEPELVAGVCPGAKHVPATHCCPLGQSAWDWQASTPEGRLCRQLTVMSAAPIAAAIRIRCILCSWLLLTLGQQPQLPIPVWQVPTLTQGFPLLVAGQQMRLLEAQQSASEPQTLPALFWQQRPPVQSLAQQSPPTPQLLPFGWQHVDEPTPPGHSGALGPFWQQLAAFALQSCPLAWQQMVPLWPVLALQFPVQQSVEALQLWPVGSQQVPLLQSWAQQRLVELQVLAAEFGRQQAPVMQT